MRQYWLSIPACVPAIARTIITAYYCCTSCGGIAHPFSSAEEALVQLRQDAGIIFAEHCLRSDLERVMQSVRELHNQGFHDAAAQHDNKDDQVQHGFNSQ